MQAVSQINLGVQTSEGVDNSDPEETDIETTKVTTFKRGTSFKQGQGGFYTQVKNRLNPPGGAGG